MGEFLGRKTSDFPNVYTVMAQIKKIAIASNELEDEISKLWGMLLPPKLNDEIITEYGQFVGDAATNARLGRILEYVREDDVKAYISKMERRIDRLRRLSS